MAEFATFFFETSLNLRFFWGGIASQISTVFLRLLRANLQEGEAWNHLDVAPSQDASDHQDYETFLVGNPYKPSFTTVTVRGPHPTRWAPTSYK